jgi:hypothetical protein
MGNELFSRTVLAKVPGEGLFMPSPLQYPLERSRDLQQKWLQRIAVIIRPIDGDVGFRKPKQVDSELERRCQEAAKVITGLLGKRGVA